MSETQFSKLDAFEKSHRLTQLAGLKGKITIWEKGKLDKHTVHVTGYHKERFELQMETPKTLFPNGTGVLLNFNLRGMTFFAKGAMLVTPNGDQFIVIEQELYKSERRSNYRLLAYPQHNINIEFDLGEPAAKAEVIDLKSKKSASKTGIFKNFLTLIKEETANTNNMRMKLNDLSTSGLSINVNDVEAGFFKKDQVFKDVKLVFSDETLDLPEVKVVYVVDVIGSGLSKKFKVGMHFENLSSKIEDHLSRKINKLLRDTDFDNDFESFIK
jgi:hypothetical protein